MEFFVEHRDNVTVVAIAGSVDALTASEVANALGAQVMDGRIRLVGDLSQVDYTSSAGLRAVLATLKDARSQGGDFRLAGLQPNVRKVLELSGFLNILKVYPDVDAAVASFA